MPNPAIATERLGKSYGAVRALQELELSVERGEILGFLGPNGAGKTTTIRLLLGFLKPTTGRAAVFGLDAWRDSVSVRRRLGYVPGDVRLYDRLTGRQLLALLASLRSASGRDYEALAERLDLDLDRAVKAYSKGNRQKLGLVQALMHRPQLILLDEPTAALDPLVQEEVYQILAERQKEGATVFFSSHVLSEVQKVCDRVAIIRNGRLLKVGAVSTFAELQSKRVEVEVSETTRRVLAQALESAGYLAESDGQGAGSAEPGVARFEFEVEGRIDPLIKLLAAFDIDDLRVEPMSLEQVFFRYYRKDELEPSA